jgi:cellulose synthase/poly-beta-1,6-N-acetylglucosamine synthase-like glycosyltransferase
MRILLATLWALSGFAIVYIVFLYPLALAWLARRRGRPVRKEWLGQTVSIVVAARNGERYMREKIETLLALDYPKELVDITIVSDGSTDRTDEIVGEYAAAGVKLMRAPGGGKAAALNRALPTLTGDLIFFTDVRQPLAPDALRRIAACFASPEVGAVSGLLRILSGATQSEADVGMYWRYEAWIRDNLSRLDSIFGATGAIYAMRRELVTALPEDILLDDMYQPLNAFFRGYRLIVETGALAYDYPTTADVEFGRKVRTLAGNYQLLRYYPQLLGPANRMWAHYVSYKFARLLLPFLMLGLLAGSFGLPAPLAWIVLGSQGAFYLLAAVDGLVPEGAALKRLSSAARTVVLILTAALLALRIFWVAPRELWRK